MAWNYYGAYNAWYDIDAHWARKTRRQSYDSMHGYYDYFGLVLVRVHVHALQARKYIIRNSAGTLALGVLPIHSIKVVQK